MLQPCLLYFALDSFIESRGYIQNWNVFEESTYILKFFSIIKWDKAGVLLTTTLITVSQKQTLVRWSPPLFSFPFFYHFCFFSFTISFLSFFGSNSLNFNPKDMFSKQRYGAFAPHNLSWSFKYHSTFKYTKCVNFESSMKFTYCYQNNECDMDLY